MDTFAWMAKGLTFSLPTDCEIVADDTSHFEIRKTGFSMTLFSFKNANLTLNNQVEVTQEAAKQVSYDKIERIEFFYSSNFKCCAVIGTKKEVKVMIMSLLNQKSPQHFAAILIYNATNAYEVSQIIKSFWRRD
ncbi:MAG: hypothetical protein OHK0057_05910 [Thermoflexibacter sp.]